MSAPITYQANGRPPAAEAPGADCTFEVAGIMPFGTSMNSVATFLLAARTVDGVTTFEIISGNVDPQLAGRGHAAGKLAMAMQRIAVRNQNRIK